MDAAPAESAPAPEEQAGFRVAVGEFEGPFDLLLSLITKHELDITEVSLSKVTDEFIAYLRRLDPHESLDEASEFLLVAATLLDLKVAGLLPQGELVDAEDVALLEARDLLFARLLQYRAFKEASSWFATRLDAENARHARTVRLEDKFRQSTPELVWTLSLDDFAALATLAMTPREIPVVGLDHLHAPTVSVREQASIMVDRLRRTGTTSFRALCADGADTMTRVARFLALLELFREGVVGFDQVTPLGELTIRWTGSDDTEVEITDEFDGSPEEAADQPDGAPTGTR